MYMSPASLLSLAETASKQTLHDEYDLGTMRLLTAYALKVEWQCNCFCLANRRSMGVILQMSPLMQP